MSGIASDTAKTAKQIAIQAAKQIAREPLEVLKAGGDQITGEVSEAQKGEDGYETARTAVAPEKKAEIEAQGVRRIQALEAEIAEIRKAKREQQLERQAEAPAQTPVEVPPMVASKPSRRMGQQNQAKREATHVEKPLPPSG